MSGQRMRSNAPVTLAAPLLCLLLAATAAVAQEAPAPAHASPRPDQLEPAVDTSKNTPTAAEAATAPAPVATPAPAAAAPRSAAGAAAAKGAPKKAAGADRLNLDTTDVRGNRELPKVMYIVPWKHSDLGDLVGRPTNSLLDEVLQPLDRDVFRRENRYYDALKPDQGGVKADAVQGSGVKP
jgi:predicted lipid-binding transport protein (Tim44 family)